VTRTVPELLASDLAAAASCRADASNAIDPAHAGGVRVAYGTRSRDRSGGAASREHESVERTRQKGTAERCGPAVLPTSWTGRPEDRAATARRCRPIDEATPAAAALRSKSKDAPTGGSTGPRRPQPFRCMHGHGHDSVMIIIGRRNYARGREIFFWRYHPSQ
jgi:hypothetical protein